MFIIFIAIAIIIFVMIIVMTTIFKRTVKVIDEQSKNYFVCKLQVYDDLIEKKQAVLEELNQKIEELKKKEIEVSDETEDEAEETNNVLDVAIPDYRDEDIFETYKKIDEKFDFDNEEIVVNFIKEHKKNISKKYYDYLLEIKNKITFDITYDLLTKSEQEQLNTLMALLDADEYEIITEYLKDKEYFDFNSFKNYLNDLIKINDPYIYIKVSKKNENYNHLDKNIKTIYDPDIFKGIVIIYQNKLYDFGLN